MALRTKTIEFAFPLSTTNVNSGTNRDFTSTTIYIPESSPTFRSVILETSVHSWNGTTSITSTTLGISLGGAAFNSRVSTRTITTSGEDMSFIFTRDVTDYFTTNWTGTSMAAGSRLTIAGVATTNASSKLIITYQYDDTATTQIKTVKIPIEGNTGNLTTTLTAVGGISGQIPALDSFLPEASKVYREIFFETYAHTGTTGNFDRALNLRFDGVTTLSATYEGSATSDYPIKRIDDITGLIDTSLSYDVEASTSNVDMPFPCLSGILNVTYEFDATTTTSVLNSLFLPIVDEDGFIPSGSVNLDRYVKKLYIQEPEDPFTGITLVQSSVLFSCIDAGAVTIDLRVGTPFGTQTRRNYVHGATVRCGAIYMMRRFDAGAAEDPGIFLSRGENDIVVDYLSTSNTDGSRGSNASAVLILNYTSGVSTQGIGAHNKTTCWMMRDYFYTDTITQQFIFTGSRTPVIPEQNYWITCNGMELKLQTIGTTVGTLATAFQARANVGEYANSPAYEYGWINYYSSMYNSDAEIGPSIMWNTCKGSFKQWPQDNRNGRNLDEQQNRTYRYDQLTAIGHLQAVKYLTYHSITCSIVGTVSNFTSAGTVRVFPHVYYNDLLTDYMPWTGSASTSGIDDSGSFNYTWYDDTINVKLSAGQIAGGGAFSRSDMPAQLSPTDGTTFDVVFDGDAGPTYYSYA